MSLVIHVGIPKSGTTFLQTQVFAKCAGLRCIGRPYQDEAGYRRFLYAVTHEEIDRKAREEISSFFSSHGGSKPEDPVILSEEALTFSPLFHAVARRLADVVPDAKILITVRNQFTAITSFYANHGRLLRGVPDPYRGRHVTFDDWLRFAHRNIDRHYQKNYLRILYYDRLLDSFAEFFDPENVKLLCYEQMMNDRRQFGAELSDILGVDCSDCLESNYLERVNPRSKERGVFYNSLRSRYPGIHKALRALPGATRTFHALRKGLKEGSPAEVELTGEHRRLITETYGASNRRLAREHNLPLGTYGYPLCDEESGQMQAAEN